MTLNEATEGGGDTPQLVLRGVSSAATPPRTEPAKVPALPATAAADDSKRRSRAVVAFFAVIVALAIGLGVGLKTGVDTTTTTTAADPLLQSIISIVVDADNSILSDSNVTNIRCAFANATGVPASRVLLVSWTDAGNTTFNVSSADPLNAGTCSPTVRRRLSSSLSSSSVSSGIVASARLLPATASAATRARYTILVNDVSIPLATRQVWASTYGLTILSVDSTSTRFIPTPSPTPTPTPTPSSTSTPSNTPTPTPSNTPSALAAGASATRSTPSQTPSTTPSALAAGASATSTPSPSPTVSDSQTPSPSPTVSDSPSNTPTPSPSPTPSSSTIPQTPIVTFPSLLGSIGVGAGVRSILEWNGRVYVGGLFTTLGDGVTSASRIAAWDGSAWSNLTIGSRNGLGGQVSALTVFGSKLYVGGFFQTLGDSLTSAKNIAAWDGTEWSNLTIGDYNGLGGQVNALAVFGSKLYVGGNFATLGDGTTSAKNIAAWDGSAWSNLTIGSSNGVIAGVGSLAVFGSKLYVGGSFATLGDGTTSAKYIAAWDGSAWSNLPSGSSNGVNSGVNALAVFGSKLYVGGIFPRLGDGTTVVNNIAAWDGSGAWSTLPRGNTSGTSSTVDALTVLGSKLYVGGQFPTMTDGTSAKRIAAWDGSAWSTLPSGNSDGVGQRVHALAAVGSKLYVGGNFQSLGDDTIAANYIAAFNVSSSSFDDMLRSPSLPTAALGGTVKSLAMFGSKVYAGGEFIFTRDGSISAKRIVAWDGSSWSTLPSGSSNGLGDSVSALAVFDSKLYVGGSFSTLGDGTTSSRIVAWDGTAWSRLPCGSGNGVAGQVYALAVFGPKLYLGGNFQTLSNGTSARRIVAWDGSAWSTLPSGGSNGLPNSVYTLAVFGSKLYVGGFFQALNDGTSAKYIAAWDGSSWSTLPGGSSNGLGGSVEALAVFGSKLFVGGQFTTLGDSNISAKRIVAWDGNVLSNLTSGSSDGVSGSVSALAIFGSKLYVGGNFLSLGDGTYAKRIALWDGSEWSALAGGSDNGVAGTVSALAANGSTSLYIGGAFIVLGDNRSPAGNFVCIRG
jgi:trimeric autotransporter adhesin